MNKILEDKINSIITKELSILSYEQIYSSAIDIAMSWNSGKKIRSKITKCLLLSRNENAKEESYELAASICATIELIHMATLIHDDVIDNNEIRRNSRTVCKYLGNKCSVLIGDLLLATALKIISNLNNQELTNAMINASHEIIHGEILQTSSNADLEITIERYMKIISKKTASLIKVACELSAIAMKSTLNEKNAIMSFGEYFGISFQILDDILDYIGDAEKTKKIKGQDFANKTITLPIILTISSANEVESKFWHKYKNNSENNFEKALFLIKKHKGIEKSKDIARIYKNKAKDNIISINKNNQYNDLLELIDNALFLEFSSQ